MAAFDVNRHPSPFRSGTLSIFGLVGKVPEESVALKARGAKDTMPAEGCQIATIAGAEALSDFGWCTDQAYAIVGSPRSGSNYLCQLLRNCGTMGNPGEYFSDRELRAERLPPEAIADRIWSAALSKGTSANGVTAIKIFPAFLERWPNPRFIASLPGFKFVHLRRRDLVDQAVSWAIGLQTMRWASFAQGWERQPRYKPKLIRQCLVTIASDSAFWDRAVAGWGSKAITLFYEDIQRDELGEVGRIADLIGLERPISIAPGCEFTTQRDAINVEFKARFLHEHCGALEIVEGAAR